MATTIEGAFSTFKQNLEITVPSGFRASSGPWWPRLPTVAVDDHRRYAFVEAIPDEKGPTTAGFLARTILAFAEAGVRVERVLTDNGGNYRSTVFQETAPALGVGLRRIRS